MSSVTDGGDNTTEPGLGPYGYEYDIHDNITRATRPAILGGDRHYEYDNTTRRLTRLRNSSFQTQIGYLYDEQGNAKLRDPSGLGMDAYAYHYDRANRLIEVRDPVDETKVEASYLYDGHARRVQVTEDGELRTQLYSQAGQYLFEEPDLITDASFTVGESKQGKPSTRYQYLGNMLIARSSGTQTTYLHTDHLGSPIAESSVGPTVEVTHLPLHEPYGAPSNGTYLDGPGYTGHVVDGLTGLSYMQARYYDPVAGRFLGVDPVHVDLGSGGNFGRYWYGNDNPYKFVDPDGRAGQGFLAAGAAGVLVAYRLYSAQDTAVSTIQNVGTIVDPTASVLDKVVAGAEIVGSFGGGKGGREAVGAVGDKAESLYRGVSANHPALPDALEGRAVPGNLNGAVSPDLHNATNSPSVLADSPYTSWTANPDVAAIHAAKDGPGGVVLRVPTGAPPAGATWSWEGSPDIYGEQERLLKGVREGAEVLRGGQ